MSDEPTKAPALISPWDLLRQHTAARIGLERSGASLATSPVLDLRLAHARARDAVHESLDEVMLQAALGVFGLPVVSVASAIKDRLQYLLRPDLGRRLAPDALALLTPHARDNIGLVFVIADGLSARAPQTHAAPLLAAVLPLLPPDWSIGPLVIVRQGRVAAADVVAATLRASMVVMLIGERPGLSSPDSMGAYFTWNAGPHSTDADRNCISNIRPEGMGYADAAFKLVFLLREMHRRQVSGVALKDMSEHLATVKTRQV